LSLADGALADYLPSGVGGIASHESLRTLMMERSGGSKGCSLSYRFSINLLEGDGSAGALEHYRPSKVSSRNEVEVTDRSLPYSMLV